MSNELFGGAAKDIQPVHNPVFATAENLDDVIFEAVMELGEMTPNRLRVLFGIYHNTLIKSLVAVERSQ